MIKKSLLAAILLLVSIPFGVAAHNFIDVIILLLLIGLSKQDGLRLRSLQCVIWLPLVLTIWTMISTVLNTANQEQNVSHYLFGYLPLTLMPLLAMRYLSIKPEQLSVLKKTAVVVSVLWALACVSQSFLGWSLKNPQGGIDFRPFGFYSHPLTLAYAALCIWPFAIKFVSLEQNRWSWSFVISIAAILIVTQSRACQGIALLVLVWNLYVQVKGRVRLGLLCALALSITLITVTNNPISNRFGALVSENNPDRFSEYPVDRMAFWHAHWEIIKERPVLGHGMHLNGSYRTPYYEKLGLHDFVKKYEAHNQFIQITANSGAIGLLIYLAWLIALWQLSRSLNTSARQPLQQMLIAFAIGSLFQNAYGDSEVRHFIMCTIVFCLLTLKHQRKTGQA